MGGCEEVKDKKCPSTGDGEGDDMKGGMRFLLFLSVLDREGLPLPLSIGDPRRINHVSTHEKKQKETNNKIPSLKVLGVLSPFFQEGAKQGSGQRPEVFSPASYSATSSSIMRAKPAMMPIVGK